MANELRRVQKELHVANVNENLQSLGHSFRRTVAERFALMKSLSPRVSRRRTLPDPGTVPQRLLSVAPSVAVSRTKANREVLAKIMFCTRKPPLLRQSLNHPGLAAGRPASVKSCRSLNAHPRHPRQSKRAFRPRNAPPIAARLNASPPIGLNNCPALNRPTVPGWLISPISGQRRAGLSGRRHGPL